MPRADSYTNKSPVGDDDEFVIWDTTAGAVKNVTTLVVATRLAGNADVVIGSRVFAR